MSTDEEFVLFPAGHVFWSPDRKSGYRLTRDAIYGTVAYPEYFEPFGDAPPAVWGNAKPSWLEQQIADAAREHYMAILDAKERGPR